MKNAIKRYMPDGSARTIWKDEFGARERLQGGTPRRASRIEVVEEGTKAGLFHVDMSPLADMTGKPEFRVCLTQTFVNYGDANKAEVVWLTENYVMEGLPCTNH